MPVSPQTKAARRRLQNPTERANITPRMQVLRKDPWKHIRTLRTRFMCTTPRYFQPKPTTIAAALKQATQREGVTCPDNAWHQSSDFDWDSDDGRRAIAAFRREKGALYLKVLREHACGKLGPRTLKGKTVYDVMENVE